MGHWKIVNFYTEEDTGIRTKTIEDAQTVMLNLEKESNRRYLAVAIDDYTTPEEEDDDEFELF